MTGVIAHLSGASATGFHGTTIAPIDTSFLSFESFLDALYSMSYIIYRLILNLLESITDFYEILAGTRAVEYRGGRVMLIELLFFDSAISYVFWGVTLIGMAFAIFFTIHNVAKRAAGLGGEKTLGSILGTALKTMLLFLIAPFIMITVVSVSGVVLTAADDMFAAKYEANMAGYVFALTTIGADRADVYEGTVNDAVRAPYLSGVKRYDNIYSVISDFHFHKISYALGILMSLALVSIYVFIFLLLIVRIFGIIIHYIVSPLFVASMALGDTGIYMKWLNSFLSKVITGFGLVLSMKIITYIVFPFLSSGVRFSNDGAADVALKFVFVLGSLYAAYKSAGTVTKLIYPEGDNDEAMVLGTARNAVVLGLKIAWEIAKAAVKLAIRLAYTLVTGGAALGAAAAGIAKDVAKTAVKTAVKMAAKTAAKVAKKAGKGE